MRAGKIVRDRMASQVSICKPGLFGFDTPELPCRDTPKAYRCQLKPESLCISCSYPSPDPPKSPLRRGTKENTPVPPFLRGARGDLDLIVKQQSLTGFDLVVDTNGLLECPYTSQTWDRLYQAFCCKTGLSQNDRSIAL